MRTYCNPLDDSLVMGDPFVLKHGGGYYLFGTGDPNEGFRCYRSRNLAEWDEACFALPAEEAAWACPPFWAPET